jgi:DNA-binding CsgD family transcriptional regulator
MHPDHNAAAQPGRATKDGVIRRLRATVHAHVYYRSLLEPDGSEFDSEVTDENLRKARIGAIALGLLNGAGVIAHLPSFFDQGLPEAFNRGLLALYAMNVVFCTLFVGASSAVAARGRRGGRVARLFMWLFLVWIYWVGIVFTVNGQNVLDHLINYLICLAFVAFGFPLPAPQALALFATGIVILTSWVAGVQHDQVVRHALNGNAISVTVLAYAASRTTFHARVSQFARTKLIERQSTELAHERSERRRDAFCLANGLTQREREILGLVLDGRPNKEIASSVFVSTDTVKKHVYHIFRKAGVRNRFALTRLLDRTPAGG